MSLPVYKFLLSRIFLPQIPENVQFNPNLVTLLKMPENATPL